MITELSCKKQGLLYENQNRWAYYVNIDLYYGQKANFLFIYYWNIGRLYYLHISNLDDHLTEVLTTQDID